MNRINYLSKKVKQEIDNNDKVAAAITLRSLLEETINRISLSFPSECESLCDKINYLHKKKYIDDKTADLFHAIRLNGNLAAHSKPGVCSIKELKNYNNKLDTYLEKNLKDTNLYIKKQLNKKKLLFVLIILVLLVVACLIFVK